MKDCYPEYTRNSQSSVLKMLTTRSASSKTYWCQISLRKDALYTTRKMQKEAAMRDHPTPVGTAKIQLADTSRPR